MGNSSRQADRSARREQREMVEDRLHISQLIRINLIGECEKVKATPEELREVLALYIRAVARTKGIMYKVDNELRYGGLRKHKERQMRNKEKR